MKDRALSNQSSKASKPDAMGQSVSPAEAELPRMPGSTAKGAPKAAKAAPKDSTQPKQAVTAAKQPKAMGAKTESDKATKSAALLPAGPFVVRRKKSLLSNPLASSGLIGVGGLALTLAVGLTLTEDSTDQQQFSFREPLDSDLGDVNAQLADSGALIEGTVKPSSATPEFSSASRIKPTQIPQISVSRTLRGPQRALAIESMLDQQTQELDRLTRLLATQTPTQPPAEGALAQAMKASAEAEPAQAAAPGDGLPGVEAADPQAAIAQLPDAPVSGTSAQAPVAAGIPTNLPEAPAAGSNALASVDLGQIRKSALAPLPAAPTEQTPPAPVAIAVDGEFAPASEMMINSSMTLAQYAATVPADMLDEFYAMQPDGQPTAVQPIVAVAPVSPEQGTETAPAAPVETPAAEATDDQGIRYFVSLEQAPDSSQRVWMLPLTDQAASEVASADKVEAFRVFRLPEQEYQRVWMAVRSVNPGQEVTAPIYGFIDYQRQIIVMPVAQAATTAATPAS